MKFVKTLLFLFISSISLSQTIEEINKTALDHYNKGNYQSAIDIGQKALVKCQQGTSENALNCIICLDNLATYYETSGRDEDALEIRLDVIKRADKVFDKTSIEYVTILRNLADLYFTMEKDEEATRVYKECINIYENNFNTKDEFYGQMLIDITTSFVLLKDYAAALPYCEGAIEFINNNGGISHPSFNSIQYTLASLYEDNNEINKAIEQNYIGLEASRINKQGTFYSGSLMALSRLLYDKGRYKEALPIFEELEVYIKSALGESDKSYSAFLIKYSNLLLALRKSDEAMKVCRESARIAKQNFGQNSLNYYISIGNIGNVYWQKELNDSALFYFKNSLKILKENFKNDSIRLANAYADLGAIYKEMGLFKESKLNYEFGLSYIVKKAEDRYDVFYNNYGLLLGDMGNFKEAIFYLKKSATIKENTFGKTHPECLEIQANIAQIYSDMNNFKESKELFEFVLLETERILGKEHPDYLLRVNNLATLYCKMGNFYEAEKLLNKLLNNNKIQKTSEQYFRIVNNLAFVYTDQGFYDKAIKLKKQMLKSAEDNLGNGHPLYITILVNLAEDYRRLGDFDKALTLYQNILTIMKENYGESHPDYALVLNNMGLLFQELGSYENSISTYGKALNIIENSYGVSHTLYGTVLNNLSSAYFKIGGYEKALVYCKKSLEISQLAYGENHHKYAVSLNNLGQCYRFLSEHEKADSLLNMALKITEKTLGKNHYEYAVRLSNLAGLNEDMGKYNIAITLYEDALKGFERSLGKFHPLYQLELDNLGNINFKNGDYRKAYPFFEEACNHLKKQIENKILFLSEKEQMGFVKTFNNSFSIYQSFSYLTRNSIKESKSWIYNNELFRKGITLSGSRNMLSIIRDEGNNKIDTLYQKWLTTKSSLSKQYSLAAPEQSISIDSLEEVANVLERELVKQSSGFQKQSKNLSIYVKDIQSTLAKEELAIEFIRFNYFNEKWTDSTMYAALFLIKDAEYPEFIFQFEEKQLKEMLSKNKTDELNQLYSSSADSSDLYHLMWQPLEPYLTGINKIYFSPSGMLHSIDLQAIQTPDGKRLGEKYNMVQMSSTREVVTTSGEPDKSSIALFGGIDYDFRPAGKDSIAKESDFHQPDLSSANRGGTEYFPPLEETKKEIEQIQKQFEANKSQTTLITGATATEEAFKSLSGKSPKILHISTHGFFFPDVEKKKEDKRMMSMEEDKTVFKISENPLLRSGLIMAHGNYAWQKGSNPYEKDDGILTAYEIANLNLSNTDLVVLSACETGLGEIKGSEGVFGLQRAFKMAGVDYLMMSLWKVPDKETKEFMQLFYSNWLGGMKIRDAFRDTQLSMSKTYEPYFWAAFVLVE